MDSLDRDGDGKLNDVDNCPDKANPDQFDEDRDLIGDACDLCPPYGTMADNKDSDGDGVGDGCDPDPNAIGNHIVMFNGFGSSDVLGAMINPVANWTVGNGVAHVMASGNTSVPHVLTYTLPTNGGAETVLARFQLTGIGANRPDGVGVVTQWFPASQNGIGCWVGYETQTNTGNLKLFELVVAAPKGLANDEFLVGDMYSIDLTRRGDTLKCSEKNAVSPIQSTTSFRGTQAGLLVKGVDASFEWLLIVDGP